MGKERYKLTVEPITCVHIGNGKELTPLDYMLVKSKQYVVFDSDSIIRNIATDKKKFSEFDKTASSNDMKKLQMFFHNEMLPDNDMKKFNYESTKYLCSVTKEFSNNYKDNENKDPLQNGRFVLQMYRPEGKKTPVIPGSSLKGSIRTAILNDYLDSNFEFNKLRGKKDNQIQQELLSFKDAKNDPFRTVQIGDCIFEGKGTQCVGIIKNVKYDRQTGETVVHNSSQIQAEVIKGYFMENSVEMNLCGESNLIINTDLTDSSLSEKAISKKIKAQNIVNACNNFYFAEFKEEYEKHYKNAENSECDLVTELYKELKSIVEKKAPNEFIIRVGRWSQVEFVTYEHDFRNPKTKKGWGKTRWVFNNDGQYLPLGWCKCTLTPIKE